MIDTSFMEEIPSYESNRHSTQPKLQKPKGGLKKMLGKIS